MGKKAKGKAQNLVRAVRQLTGAGCSHSRREIPVSGIPQTGATQGPYGQLFWRCGMAVFVLDKHKKPLMPCSEKRARLLLVRGRAVVYKRFPFAIRLKDRIASDSAYQPLRLKLDPGSKATGVAMVRDTDAADRYETVVFLAEIQHRGQLIKSKLDSRRSLRRNRRNRKTRYRAPRFDNRTRPAGWLAPSLRHRVDTTTSWVGRLSKLAPVSTLSQELVRFDMQIMQNPEINGVEYQQGELQGYEVREYLLNKFSRCCTYCGAKNTPLEIEHIRPKARGGSNRVSNLCLSCRDCNEEKGTGSIDDFLAKKPELLARILKQLKAPLKDAAAVNATRWALANTLKTFGYPLELASGGRTKFNRRRLDVPKSHALDAACVGAVETLSDWNLPTLVIKCTGRGSYQRTRLNKYGFPRGYLMRQKSVKGFQTGDMVCAIVPKGVKAGTHIGRVAIRATGSFDIQTPEGVVQSISHKHCQLVCRADGYGYSFQPKIAFNKEEARKGNLTTAPCYPSPT
jgi:5-methylcytosine-specific restriction endonuclease McrA